MEWTCNKIISELCSQLLHSHHVPPPTHTSTHQFTFSLQSLVACHSLLVVESRGWSHYLHSHNWKSVNTGNTDDLNYHPQQVIMTDTAKMHTSSLYHQGNYWSQPLVFTPHCQYLLPLPTTWHTLSPILTDSCFSLLPTLNVPLVVLASIFSLV